MAIQHTTVSERGHILGRHGVRPFAHGDVLKATRMILRLARFVSLVPEPARLVQHSRFRDHVKLERSSGIGSVQFASRQNIAVHRDSDRLDLRSADAFSLTHTHHLIAVAPSKVLVSFEQGVPIWRCIILSFEHILRWERALWIEPVCQQEEMNGCRRGDS